MCAKRTPPRAIRELPAQPNLEHLKNEAKQRLKALRAGDPATKLAAAQLAVARDYGFASWRQLKAHVERASADRPLRDKVFAAAQSRRHRNGAQALNGGFDPRQTDAEGRTVHQIAKEYGHEAIELLARELEERDDNPPELRGAVESILDAAEKGHADKLRKPARQPSRPDRRPRRQFPEADRPAQGGLAKPARLRASCCSSAAPTCASATPATTPTPCISRRKPPTLPSSSCWSRPAPT